MSGSANGMKFSTWDKDNDRDKNGGNCAEFWKGVWWFNG